MKEPEKVTRYGLEYSSPVLHEQPNGLYVHYIDYFALERAHAEVTAMLVLPLDIAQKVMDAVKASELPVSWEQAVVELLTNHDIWEKHSLTQLVTENRDLTAERDALKGQVADLTERETILTEAWRKCGIERSQLSDALTTLVVALGGDLLNAQFPESTDWPAVVKRIRAVLASPEVAAYRHKDAS